MVGYQGVDDDGIEEGETEIREAEAGTGTLRDRAMHGAKTFAYANPKAAAGIGFIIFYLICHIAWVWFPTLIFWFLVVPGICVGLGYVAMNKIPNITLPFVGRG